MMLDLPQPLGPTTPTSWPGSRKLVGSAKDLKPESLIELRRTAWKKGWGQRLNGIAPNDTAPAPAQSQGFALGFSPRAAQTQ
ncbi:hypothetical protein D3C71_1935410 [compost metagenome]